MAKKKIVGAKGVFEDFDKVMPKEELMTKYALQPRVAAVFKIAQGR